MLAGARALFGVLCRIVGQPANVADIARNFLSDIALLHARRSNLRHHIVDAPDRIAGFIKRLIHTGGTLDTVTCLTSANQHGFHGILHAGLQALDHFLNILGGILRPRGQRTYFIGHHRKAATLFTGTRRFDGGIECQQVGLLGNPANHRQYRADIGGFLLQGLNGARGILHLLSEQANGIDGRTDHQRTLP